MISTHLIQWIEHPETLDRDSLYELRTLIRRYPYFHSLRLLYLKNLYLLHDAAFGDELRKSALFVADRSVLFYQIEGSRYALQPQQPLPSARFDAEGEEGQDRTLFLIDSFLQTAPDEQPQTTAFDYSMDYTAFLLSAEADEGVQSEESAAPKLRGQSLIDDFLSKADAPQEREWGLSDNLPDYDFSGLDDDSSSEDDEVEKLEVTEDSEEECLVSVATDNSVETFADSSAASPVQNSVETAMETSMEKEDDQVAENIENPVDEKGEEEPEEEAQAVDIPVEEETFTETLAKIYVKQHRYDKALEIIKKLSLNYPKKNAYFADQIRFLEKLIINAKSK